MTTAVATRKTATKRKTSTTTSEPPLDPATQYARDVVTGAILAGRAVRLACHRHLRDLERQRTPEFPYYFDVQAALHIIYFFPTFLTLENGDPFHLPAWLQFCYGCIFGWKCWGGEHAGEGKYDDRIDAEHARRHGLRKLIHGFFETSKGSGKTPSAGGVTIYGLSMDDESHAEIYSTGFDKGQASIILNDAIRMVNDCPDEEFASEFIADKYNIAHPASGSFARAASSQHRSKSGPRPSYVLSDEIHEHRDGTVVTKMESGFKNRLQPLGLKYTNSGSDKTSYCWQLHQKSIEVLEGTLVDEQWFAYVCHLDPCQKCYDEGYRQPKDGCKDCDDWTDPAVWPKIAPALGVVIQPKYLQDAIDKARSIESEFSLVRRLNFCIWTETHQVWISSERLDACRVDAVSADNPDARPCAAGLDLSSKIDLSSLVVALRIDDPPAESAPEEVTIDGMDEEGERVELKFTLNFSVELIPFFWMPKDTLLERVQNEHIPYDVWERGKHLFATDGPVIDHDAIYHFIKDDAWKRFKIQRLGYDEKDATMLAVALRDRAKLGDKVVAIGQAKKLSETFKLMEVLARTRRLRHAGNPVLMWNFANAEPQRDRLKALWIEKPSEIKRIDGVIAAAMAINQLMVLPTKRRSVGAFIV